MNRRPVIVAPVCTLEDARAAITAGAGELYCGVLPEEWIRKYSESDLLSRRQSRAAHVATIDELSSIVSYARENSCPIALTLNVRYSAEQEPEVIEIAGQWQEMGGDSILISDPGLMLELAERGSRLRRHISTLAGVFNGRAVDFFADLGASRIVLPRDLTIEEIRCISSARPEMEFEALVLNQKCQFVDGLCGFLHSVRLPEGIPADFQYENESGSDLPVVRSYDPDYEGHGCELSWQTPSGVVRNITRYDFNAPHCAACMLGSLCESGVRYFKIAGRAYPSELISASVGFIREAIELLDGTGLSPAAGAVRELYSRRFGGVCREASCYYRER